MSKWKEWLKYPAKSTKAVVQTTTNTILGRRETSSVIDILSQLQDPRTCQHLRVDTSQDQPVCDDCGSVITDILKDDNGSKGESRCFHHNNNPRDISPDLQGKNIPEAIKQLASVYYLQVINYNDKTGEGDTRRKGRRRAIIAACVGQAYRDRGSPKSAEFLADMFDIEVTDYNKKGVNSISHIITTPMGRTSITPMNYVPDMLKNLSYLNLGSNAYSHIDKLWGYVRSLSGKIEYNFDSRRPSSMAAALIYFYARLKLSKVGKNDKFDVQKFATSTGISTNTFQTIAIDLSKTIEGAESINL